MNIVTSAITLGALLWLGAYPLTARATPEATTQAPTQAAATASPLIPLEAFAQLPFLEGPQLSPSGAKVAARAAVAGQQHLVIQNGKEKPVVISLGDTEFRSVTWVTDDWLLVEVGRTEMVLGTNLYVTRLVSVSADGKKMMAIPKKVSGQNGADLLWKARDGTPRILMGYQNSIFLDDHFWTTVVEVDVSTGKLRTVVHPTSGIMDYYADGDGIVRLARRYDDRSRVARLLSRTSNKETFHEITRADHKQEEYLTIPTIFSADPGKAIVTSNEDGFEAVYEYDLVNMKIGQKLFGVPGYDIDSIVPSLDGKSVAGVRYTDTRQRTAWLDPEMKTLQADIGKAVGPNRWAHIVSMSRTRSAFLVDVGAPDRPGTFYYYSPAAGRMEVMAHKNSALPPRRFAPVKTIKYKARDGLEIAAVLTLPTGRDARNLPLILLPHGGPHARDTEEWDWWTQFLASRGYAVIQPNYRGSSGYGSTFEEMSEGQWGRQMQDDLNDALDWTVKQGIADEKRVCIMGGSYGGYAALRGAQRDGARFRCAISYAGVSDLTAMLRYDRRFLYSNQSKAYWLKEAVDLKDVSPINFPGQFSTPVLIVHGKMDLRVPVSQSREMAEKLKQAGKPVRYVEQPKADHHFSREADRVQFLQEVEAFLKQYNPS